MPEPVRLRILAESGEAVSNIRLTREELQKIGVAAKEVAATATRGAREQVAALVREREEMRKQLLEIQNVSRAYRTGSEEKRAATRLEIDLQRKLAATYAEAGHVARAESAKTARAAREASQVERGALRGATGRGFGMATNVFLAGAVGGLALKDILSETKLAQTSQALLRNALAQTGQAWRANTAEVEDNLTVAQKRSGFDRVQLRDSLATLVRGTRSLTKAQEQLTIVEDVAHGRHMALQAATMLVTRAQLGNVGALRRLGIDAQKVTTYEDQLRDSHVKSTSALKEHAKALDLAATKAAVMSAVQSRFAGASAAYMHTLSGRLDALHNTFQELEVELGTALTPVLTRFVKWLTDVITKARESKKFHDQLTQTFRALKQVLDVVVSSLHAAYSVFTVLGRAVGGQGTLIKGLVVAWALYKGAMTGAMVATRVQAIMTSTTIKGALISSGIGALVVAVGIAVALIITHWTKVRKWLAEFGAWIKEHAYALFALPVVGQFAFAAVEVIKHWQAVKSFFAATWKWLKETALQAALDVIEPWSHLPGRFGSWARKAKDAIQTELWDSQVTSATRAAVQATAAYQLAWDRSMQKWKPVDPLAQAASGEGASGRAGGASGVTGGTVMGGETAAQSHIVGTAVTAAARPGASTSYRYGGAPSLSGHTDCSGFTQAVMKANGISIGRTSEAQYAQGTPVSWDKLEPGDLIFFDTHDMDKPPSHVGLFVGNGQMIHDAHTGSGIVYANLTGYWAKNFMGGRRYVKGAGRAAGASGRAGSNPDTAAEMTSARAGGGVSGPSASDVSAFDADLAAAPKTGGKKKPKAKVHHVALASMEAVQAARETIEGEIKDVKAIQKAGMGDLVKGLDDQLKQLEGRLHKGMTRSAFDTIKRQIAQAKAEIKRALQIEDLKKTAATMLSGIAKAFDFRPAAQKTEAQVRATLNQVRTQILAIQAQLTQGLTSEQIAILKRKLDGLKTAYGQALQDAASIVERKAQAISGALSRVTDMAMQAFDRTVQKHLDSMRAALDEQIAAIEEAGAAETPAEGQLRQLQAGHDAAQAQRDMADAQANLAKAQAALANAKPEDDVEQLKKDVQDATDAINEYQYQAQVSALQRVAEDQRKQQDKQTQALITNLQKQEAIREQNYQDQMDAARNAYGQQIAAQEEMLQNGQEDYATFTKNVLAIMQAFGVDPTYFIAGNAAGTAFADAFAQALQQLFQLLNDLKVQAEADLALIGAVAAAGAAADATAKQAVEDADPTKVNPSQLPHLATGGPVGRAAGGFMAFPKGLIPGNYIGRDSVPALLEPGEYVETREQAAAGGRTVVNQTIVNNPTVLGATPRQVGRALEGLVTPQFGRVARYNAPF